MKTLAIAANLRSAKSLENGNLEMDRNKPSKKLTRRGALELLAGTAGAMAAMPVAAVQRPAHTLSIRSIHTGERVTASYREGGELVPDAMGALGTVLRDWRTDEIYPMDPHLLDYLVELKEILSARGSIDIISGYRSPKTNARLAAQSSGVAKRSLHMQGRAIDLAFPNHSVAAVRKAALSLKQGGVGAYSRSGFVHIDTGRFRTWGS